MIHPITLSLLLILGCSPFAAAADTPAAGEATKVERLKTDQWCWTHDVPKDKCVTCDRKLIPALKKAKDWCSEHEAPESICVKCDPKGAKAQIDALRPTEKPKDVK
ncbi:MAG: hypothetical protein J0M02_00110 [Planctomycetes bacterium]|nr:hypothetical protein [Planctomycetota bacterium]